MAAAGIAVAVIVALFALVVWKASKLGKVREAISSFLLLLTR